MKQRLPSFADAKAVAAGKWAGILIAAGMPPEKLNGKHQDCLGCGGRDRFRYVDSKGDGYFICGRGGDPLAGDGFALLQHALGMTPRESLEFVAGFLGLEGREVSQADRDAYKRRQVLEALSFELEVLRIAIGDRLANKALNAADAARERLAIERIARGLGVVHDG